MSGNQPTTSPGDSTAQPPTPKQTPTSTTSFFPSPVFETPQTPRPGLTDLPSDSSTITTTPGPDWTPRFAEDFSVFNTTPGNLRRGSQDSFADFSAPFASPNPHETGQLPPAPSPPPTTNSHKRPLSLGSFAAELASSHVHPSIPSSSLCLPPVEPSRRLQSSPGPLVLAALSAAHDEDTENHNDHNGNDTSNDGENDNDENASGSRDHRARVPKKARRTAPTSASKTARDPPAPAQQTATPPPSTRKRGRKIAPKLKTTTAAAAMQSDEGFGPPHTAQAHAQAPPDFFNTPQQQHMATFVASPADVFSYPMSAPPTASVFADARPFWATTDAGMAAMDVDYSAASTHMFDTPTSVNRQLDGIDWTQAGPAGQGYMVTGAESLHPPPQAQHPHQHPHLGGHHLQPVPMAAENLDPKQMMPPNLDTSSIDHQAIYAGSYPTPADDPFAIMSPNGGVNPGLLFSRPPSSSMDVMASAPPGAPTSLSVADAGAAFDPRPQSQPQSQPQPQLPPQPQLQSQPSGALPMSMARSSPPLPLVSIAPAASTRKEIRRSASAREIAPKKTGERTLGSSPVKASMRPSLSRSFSENRGPRLQGRASLPTLAPAIKTSALSQAAGASALSSNIGTGLGITRSHSFGGGRPTGRSSPIRMHHRQQQQQQQQHQQFQQQQQQDTHHRPSGLTSIPEVNTPRSRASVKFTIDANGRARVEAMVDEEDGLSVPRTALRRNRSARSLAGKPRWDSSTDDDNDDDSSSTDDEPIIIPSQPTSFALPDPVKPMLGLGRGPLHASQRSISDRSTASSAATVPSAADALYNHDAPLNEFNDAESEAETVMNELLPKGAGDAASELEKLRHMRQKRASLPASLNMNMNLNVNLNTTPGGAGHGLFGSPVRGLPFGGPLSAGGGGVQQQQQHGHRTLSSQAISPTTFTDASLPTPSTGGSRSHRIRCICGRVDAPPLSDGFIVQCESCDMWLHGRCINITKRTLPSVYICAFCAQTPNARDMHDVRGGRFLPPGAGSSPLAHKSLKKFR